MAQLQPAEGDKRGAWAGDRALSRAAAITQPDAGASEAERRWLRITLLFALFCGAALLWWAFRAPYVVEDDARQHVFWMLRFQNPGVFPGDLTVAYFQDLAPPGFAAFYWLLAHLGVSPLLVAKLLPPVLLLATALFTYRAACAMWREPAAAGIGTLLYLQVLATNDDLASGTPRAFIAPLLTGFLYFLVKRRLAGTLLCLALLGLIYPQMALLALGVLVLHTLDRGRGEDVSRPFPVGVAVAGVFAVLATVLPYHLHQNSFGPLVTAAQARSLPEFGPGARSEFFNDNPLLFWLIGSRSGFVPLLYHSPVLWAGFALQFLRKRPGLLSEHGRAAARLLAHMAVSSLLLYAAAHLLLFKLHLPSRYIRHSLPLVLALAAGPVLLAGWRWACSLPATDRRRKALPALAVTAFVIPSLLVPLWNPGFVIGRDPALYRFFAATPPATRVGSISEEAENLPAFSQRSNLFSSQCALAYHRGYYEQMQQRATDLLRAQYTDSAEVVKQVVRRYGVDFFVLDRRAYSPGYLESLPWLRPFLPGAGLAAGTPATRPVMQEALADALVLDTGQHWVLDAERLMKRLGSASANWSGRAPALRRAAAGAPEAPPAW